MIRRRMIVGLSALGILLTAILVVGAVIGATQTAWGRGHIRTLLVGELRRIVHGRVYVGDRHINLDQVREGYGWHHAEHENIREFADAERDAREHQRGLWKDRRPVQPWRYRQEHRQAERIERDVR